MEHHDTASLARNGATRFTTLNGASSNTPSGGLSALDAVASATPAISRVRLGPYEFDMKAGELVRGRRKIILQNQPRKILLMLMKQPGEVVTREEIQQCLWPGDVIVNFEVSINQAISKLRRALDDGAAEPALIETVGRRGYRLKVVVEPLAKQSHLTHKTSDAVFQHDPMQMLAGAIGAVAGPEELRLIAEGLTKLLKILAHVDPPTLHWLETRSTVGQQPRKTM